MARNKRRGRVLPNGRNAVRPFIMIENWVFDSRAFRALKPGPRALLLELIRRHNGSNNGQIGLGVREAAKALNADKTTVNGYFKDLQVVGLIAPGRPGGFNMKVPTMRRASEWRLTWQTTESGPATKEFLTLPENSTVRKIRTPSPENPDTASRNEPECPKNPDLSAANGRLAGTKNPDAYTSCHGQCLADGVGSAPPQGAVATKAGSGPRDLNKILPKMRRIPGSEPSP